MKQHCSTYCPENGMNRQVTVTDSTENLKIVMIKDSFKESQNFHAPKSLSARSVRWNYRGECKVTCVRQKQSYLYIDNYDF